MRHIAILTAFVLAALAVARGAPAPSTPTTIPVEGGMVIVALPVSNADVETVAEQVRGLVSQGGTVAADPRTRRLFVRDLPENIARIRAFIESIDTALPMVSLTLQAHGLSRVSGTVTEAGTPSRANGGGLVVTVASGSGTLDASGSLQLVTMSGSEGFVQVGDRVTAPFVQYFQSDAVRRGLLAPQRVLQSVSCGFAVVPRVVGDQEVMLSVYPRIAYTSAGGPGVIRIVEAACEARARNGQTVEIALASSRSSALVDQILRSGGYAQTEQAWLTITPRILVQR